MTASPPLVPTAPPLHGVAPAGLLAPQAPAPTGATSALSTDEIVAFIEASADPAAELAHLVLQVSMRAATATRQGQILSSVNSRCAKALKAVRVALLTAVANTPGVYDGFTVTQKAGAALGQVRPVRGALPRCVRRAGFRRRANAEPQLHLRPVSTTPEARFHSTDSPTTQGDIHHVCTSSRSRTQ